MKNETMIIFTLNYPFGSGEEFIENEIKFASIKYKQIIVVPNQSKGDVRPMPVNCKVVKWDSIINIEKKVSFTKFLRLFFKEIIIQKSDNLFRLKAIKVFWSYYKEQLIKSAGINNLIQMHVENIGSLILYDFWFTNNALAITLVKEKHVNIKYIACAHNFDLYDFRWGCPIPFRGIAMKQIENIFPDSKYGIKYLKSKVSKSLHPKIKLAYMGTPDFGLSPIPTEGKIRFLSTSTCIPHKRVDWIIKSLAKLNGIDFVWIHFGDGDDFDSLQQLAKDLLPAESFEFYGWVKFNELIGFYKNNQIDMFIHMSTAEGLPVSLMIASSFGVPVLAIDSMGVSELINSKTGQLMRANSTIDEVVIAINLLLNNMCRSEKMRHEAREYCMQHFSTNNYKEFYDTALDFKD